MDHNRTDGRRQSRGIRGVLALMMLSPLGTAIHVRFAEEKHPANAEDHRWLIIVIKGGGAGKAHSIESRR